jgi:hypothetical protein
MLFSGRVVPFSALLTMKNRPYYRTWTINGFVASIFFAFFKVFLAMLFPPRLICPTGHRSLYMQSSRQTPQPMRQTATRSICDTSRRNPPARIQERMAAALN